MAWDKDYPGGWSIIRSDEKKSILDPSEKPDPQYKL